MIVWLLHFSKDLICTTISTPQNIYSILKKILKRCPKKNLNKHFKITAPNFPGVQFFALFLERVVLIESSLVDPPVELSSRLDFL